MKLDELIERVGVDNVGVQVLADAITGGKQRRGYVEVSFGTDCVSMRDIATGQWDNVVFVVSVKRDAFEAARAAATDKGDGRDAVGAKRITEIARKWMKKDSESSPEFYWGDFYDCVREIISGSEARCMQQNIWQPIETAPKTGRTLLLGYQNSLGKWRTTRGQWMSDSYIAEYWEVPDDVEQGWFETSVEADDTPNCWRIEPTHWMPLPTAPAALPQQGEQG